MEALLEYLNNKGFPYKDSSSNEIVFKYCPYCEKSDEGDFSHFYFSKEKETFYCHKCGAKGGLYRFKKDQGDIKDITKIKNEQYFRPKENKSLTDYADNWYVKLSKLRGISVDIIKKYKMGFTKSLKDNQCMVYQYYSPAGILFNRKYKQIDKDEKGKREIWTETKAEKNYYGLQFVDFHKKYLHVCAGEDDCHALVQYGLDNVVSVPLGDTNYNQEMDSINKKFDTIYLLFDSDESGQKGALKFASIAGYHKCINVVLPFKDARECLLNNITVEELKLDIECSSHFETKDIVKIGSMKMLASDYIYRHCSNGVMIKSRGFDKIVQGVRLGELSVLTGHTGRGKSTWSLNFMNWCELAGMKAMLMSFENTLEHSIEKLVEICSKSTIKVYDEAFNKMNFKMTREDFEKHIDDMDKRNFYFLNTRENENTNYNIEMAFDIMRCGINFYSINLFIVDHLFYLINLSGEKNPVYVVDDYMKQFSRFAVKNNVHILLLTHPVKTHDREGKPVPLGLNSAKGSGSVAQEAFNFWIIERDPEKGTVLRIEKTRKNGRVGEVTYNVLENNSTYEDTEK